MLIHGRKGEKRGVQEKKKVGKEKRRRIVFGCLWYRQKKKDAFCFRYHTHTDIYLSIPSNVRKCIKRQKKTEKRIILRVKAETSFSL